MTEPLLYGIWIPGKGWKKGTLGKPIAFESRLLADDTALRLGQHARAEFIDESLMDLEHDLLVAEAQAKENNLWHTLTNLLRGKRS